MFAPHPDKMRMEATPERVLCVCRMIAGQSMPPDELIKLLSFDDSDTASTSKNIIKNAINVAQNELCLLQLQDGKLKFSVAPEIISSPESFRKYVSAVVFSRKESTFFLFSKWYIAKNEQAYSFNNWEIASKTAERESPQLAGIDDNAALGWRFWAAFAGLGYLNGAALIPNLKIRLQDILCGDYQETFAYGQPVRAQEFISWLAPRLPEAELDSAGPLPLAVSAGLRTLHELNLIVLEARRDTERTPLYDGDPALTEFSHITVRKEVAG